MKKVFILRLPAQYFSQSMDDEGKVICKALIDQFYEMIGDQSEVGGIVLPAVWDTKRDSYLYDIEVVEIE